jgi:hypothetical protein
LERRDLLVDGGGSRLHRLLQRGGRSALLLVVIHATRLPLTNHNGKPATGFWPWEATGPSAGQTGRFSREAPCGRPASRILPSSAPRHRSHPGWRKGRPPWDPRSSPSVLPFHLSGPPSARRGVRSPPHPRTGAGLGPGPAPGAGLDSDDVILWVAAPPHDEIALGIC